MTMSATWKRALTDTVLVAVLVTAEDTRKRIAGFLEMTVTADSGSVSARCALVRSRQAQGRQYVQSSYSWLR